MKFADAKKVMLLLSLFVEEVSACGGCCHGHHHRPKDWVPPKPKEPPVVPLEFPPTLVATNMLRGIDEIFPDPFSTKHEEINWSEDIFKREHEFTELQEEWKTLYAQWIEEKEGQTKADGKEFVEKSFAYVKDIFKGKVLPLLNKSEKEQDEILNFEPDNPHPVFVAFYDRAFVKSKMLQKKHAEEAAAAEKAKEKEEKNKKKKEKKEKKKAASKEKDEL